jgi:hypothetical protein
VETVGVREVSVAFLKLPSIREADSRGAVPQAPLHHRGGRGTEPDDLSAVRRPCHDHGAVWWFRLERDPANVAPGTNYRISDLELASRLSFFLWSSIPDDELLDVAARGKWGEPAVFDQQVRRMLGDPRSFELVRNFAGQWLQLRNLDAVEMD